jgi:KRAB domain-containing zinc finger protein
MERQSPCICRDCCLLFNQAASLQQHERRHAGAGTSAPYVCCGKGFFSKANLTRHRCAQHNQTKAFVCQHCSKSFALQADLNRHQRREQKRLKLNCPLCDFACDSKGIMDDHEDTHMDIKRHRCTICLKVFRHQTNLSRHMKTHKRVDWFSVVAWWKTLDSSGCYLCVWLLCPVWSFLDSLIAE